MEDDILIKGMILQKAEKKSAKEQCILAEGYLFGYGEVQKDSYMAFRLYEMAAKNNSTTAKFNLANMYIHGDGTQKDVKKAIQILESLVRSKDILATIRLADIYFAGEHVERDVQKSIKLYNDSVKLGSKEAAFQLARIYDEGSGVEQNFEQAKKYYEISAKKGYTDALVNLGYMYEQGKGVAKDYAKAVEYYQQAAEKGNAIAEYNLGCAYLDGKVAKQDNQKAFDYLTKAKEQGFIAAEYNLGLMYFRGQGVEQDYEKAKEYFFNAAKQNEAQSCYMLGYLYNMGKGIEQNFEKAIEYYTLAAENGDATGYSDLGYMYNRGRGVEKDHKKAVEFFEKGVRLGDDSSKCNLAVAYANGSGVEKDIDKAIEILETVNDEFVNKFYFIATIKRDYLEGKDRTKEILEEAIQYYNKYLENMHLAEDVRYLPIIYYKLAECYLDLYYLDEVNEQERTKEHFLKNNSNREKAKEYLKLARERKLKIDIDVEIFENDLRIAEDLLNDNALNLKELNYEQFKKQFLGKYENLFLLTNKKEFEIYDEGIKYYFEKREQEKGIKQKIYLAEENFERRKPLIRKRLEELKVLNIEEKLNELKEEEITKTKNSLDIDFSNAVINIDKYLEEILHYLFVDCMHEHKLDLCKQLVVNNINEIEELLKDCSQEILKDLNLILNGIDKSVELNRDVLTKKIEIFADRFNKNWNWKSVADEKIADLNAYYDENKDCFDVKETRLIEKLLENAEAREEFANLEKPERFELGKLFHMAIADVDNGSGLMPQKVVDSAFVEFVMSINEKMNQNEAALKLSELLVKVEMFRVIVRNVASHKTTLTQSAVEHGLNISIVQENSIFKLMDEIFGDFLNKKYVDQIVNGI